MAFEQFNPADPKYKTTADLPAKLRGNFQDVPGGFVRKEAAEYEEGLKKRVEKKLPPEFPGAAEEQLTEQRMQEAQWQDQDIAGKVKQKIADIEFRLGKKLSDEAKQQIYQNEVPNAATTAQERHDRYVEGEQFRHVQIEELANSIVAMPEEEFQGLPLSKKREIFSQCTEFNRNIPNETPAANLHKASERLLREYKPSSELSQLNQEVHQALLQSFSDQELRSLQMKWDQLSLDEHMTLVQRVVGVLSEKYGLMPPNVIIPKQPMSDVMETMASYSPSANGGTIFIHKPDMAFSGFDGMITTITHEMAHAHQKKLVDEMNQSEAGSVRFAEDAQWFDLNDRLEQVYDRDFYRKHYNDMPKEQDAFQAQDDCENIFLERRRAIDERWNVLLKEHGLPSVLEIGNRSLAVATAEKALASGKVKNGDELVQYLFDEELIMTSDTEPLFKGKSLEECAASILKFREMREQALALLPNDRAQEESIS